MRTRTLLPAMLVLLAAAARGGDAPDEALSRRIDSLIARWTGGDAAARAGVVAETRALGDEAVAELFSRLARAPEADEPSTAPGVRMSEEKGEPRRDRVVGMTIRVGELQAEAPKAARVWTDEEIAKLEGKVAYVSAPRLTVYDRQRANVSILDQRTFVRTFDERKQPVQGTVQSGLTLDLRPRISADGKTVSLELKCTRAQLEEPVAKLDTPAGAIELPVVATRQAALTLDVVDGGRKVIALPSAGIGGQGALVVALEAHVTALEDVPAEFPGDEIELK